MTKAELIDSIASKTELPKGTAERIVATIFDDIVGALKGGDKVHISGFGTFQVSERKARTGRNPKLEKRSRLPLHVPQSSNPARRSKTALN
jgi:DNA-binding protein HU-beta